MKRVLLILGVILVASAGVFAYQRLNTPPPPPPQTEVVTQPRIQTVSVEARLAPARQARLAFNGAGRVQEVLVQAGDTVQAGQVLVRLESAALRDVVRQAEAGVQVAQAQLQRAKLGPRAEDIAVAEMAVRVAEAQLARAQAGPRAEDIGVAQAGLNAARTDLARARVGATAQDLETARLSIEQAKNQLWSAQAQRDAVCGRTGDAEKTLQKLGIPQAECDAARAVVNSSEQAVQIAEQAYAKLAAGPRAEDVNTVAARVEQAQAQVRAAQGGPRPVDVQVATVLVEQAQAQARAAQVGARPVDVQVATVLVEQAQAQLAQAKAGPRAADVAVAEAEVARAEAALQAARTALAETELKAPFAGVVAQVLLQPGEAATPATPALQLGDTHTLRLETEDLAETDVAKIVVGQTASVALDALPEQSFKAKVTRISPVSAERRGDTVYTVWLDFDGGAPEGALWGMKALVDIQLH
ncbi:MAG: efflux RND transporter periplasmic adaptor subunit [Anaerolineae bacterium]|nr:efflux RND transporter periplasmic adaptor subunit [Anaerolineae bacterium]